MDSLSAPTQIGKVLSKNDSYNLPYSQLPKAALTGDFIYNPATRIGSIQFNYVDYIIKPFGVEDRIYQMLNPRIFKAGTLPAAIRPKQPMRLTSYADVVVRDCGSVIFNEDHDLIGLIIQPDGSVQVDGTLYFQHHNLLQPNRHRINRWRVEIAASGGSIFF